MNQVAIFAPVLALMGWTFLVLLLIPYRRFKAGFTGGVTFQDFRYGESDRVPFSVKLPNRVFMNLLEMPVLFYILCTILYVTHYVDVVFVGLAWTYFVFRVLHSVIYLTYNHVFHRFLSFAISNLIVLSLWIRLIMAISGE